MPRIFDYEALCPCELCRDARGIRAMEQAAARKENQDFQDALAMALQHTGLYGTGIVKMTATEEREVGKSPLLAVPYGFKPWIAEAAGKQFSVGDTITVEFPFPETESNMNKALDLLTAALTQAQGSLKAYTRERDGTQDLLDASQARVDAYQTQVDDLTSALKKISK